MNRQLGKLCGLGLLLLGICSPGVGQGLRYNNFNWTYGRHNSAGIGAEGTTFTALARLEQDTLMAFTALSVPLPAVRSALGGYLNQQLTLDNRQQWADAGLSYTLVLPFEDHASFRLGVQHNWHRLSRNSQLPTDIWMQPADSTYSTTDFGAFIKRDHLLLGVSAEDALNKAQRSYLILAGFRELQTYSWLKSSPFFSMSLLAGRETPEFRLNYTATLFNTLSLGASVYRHTPYVYGLNGGLKLFDALWLSGSLDFAEFNSTPNAVELGIRLNLGKNRIRCFKNEYRPQELSTE